MKINLFAISILCSLLSYGQVYKNTSPLAHTFSIVARDSMTGEMAVGVQSHWFSVGTSVSWAEAGVGAVATQSFIDKSYGYNGLALMKQGFTANEALDSLLKKDSSREVRQVAFVDSKGNVASFTGKNCIQYASHIKGSNFSVQSNMMLTNDVCENMEVAFKTAEGKPLAERVLAALDAAQKTGGDIRGKQSAALLLVPGTATQPWNDKTIDVRVDDSEAPLPELRRLYNLSVAYGHMNNGDLATEKGDMQLAKNEYNAAMKMFPGNLEMQYWTAITLANNGNIKEAFPMLKSIFSKDNNWKELTRRLPPVGLLMVSEAELKQILSL